MKDSQDVRKRDLDNFLRHEVDSLLAHAQKRGLDQDAFGLALASTLGQLVRCRSDDQETRQHDTQMLIQLLRASAGTEAS